MPQKYKIALGSDHAGFDRKSELLNFLKNLGHQIQDMGCPGHDSCDYPDFAQKVAEAVSQQKADKGILVCGTGIGMAIAANKVPGIRAAVCWNVETAKAASAHNQANVLCLPGRLMQASQMQELITVWLSTPFEGDRHQRRVDKIKAMERC